MQLYNVNIANPAVIVQAQFNWQGNWNNLTLYTIGQVVRRGSGTYICIASNTDIDPATDVNFINGVGTYWSVVVSDGSTIGVVTPYTAPYVKSLASNGSVSVGTTSTLILPSNITSLSSAGRSQFYVYNDSSVPVYLSYGGPAAANQGIRLNPNGGMNTSMVYQGAIYGISPSGTVIITYVEI